jgi:hypothetical protein
MKKNGLIITLILISPIAVSAQIIITEIMYDLEGSDSGREWVEITNVGSETIDVSSWKLHENDTNHGLTLIQGDANLSSGQSAIIADNPSKFLIDWPSFNGTLLDSSFSLKNTGEQLYLRDQDLIDIDSVNYDPLWGAEGDGNSLQKSGSSWLALSPTPGQYNSGEEENEEENPPPSPNVDNEDKDVGSVAPYQYPKEKISTRIISEKIFLSGADSLFKADSLGTENEKLEGARHSWNFGDGTLEEGEQVLHNFVYPGEYIVFLEVISGKYYTSERIYVSVIPSSLSITDSEMDFIKLHNDSSKELNISYWMLSAGDKTFVIPGNTYIKTGGDITFSRETTGLDGRSKPLRLLYPNGKTAYDFDEAVLIEDPQVLPQKEIVVEVVEKVSVNDSENIKNTEESNQLAAAVISNDGPPTNGPSDKTLEKNDGGFLNKWSLGVLGIIVLSILSVLFIKREDMVEGYTIIE